MKEGNNGFHRGERYQSLQAKEGVHRRSRIGGEVRSGRGVVGGDISPGGVIAPFHRKPNSESYTLYPLESWRQCTHRKSNKG